MKSLMALLRNTITHKKLIQDGDRIAVGLSGGKDSMVLLHALNSFKTYGIVDFDLCAITINPGFDGFDAQPLRAYCSQLDIPFYEEITQIYEVVFNVRNEKNPCALCAKMRRGALVDVMKRKGYKTLALGHHNDDALATFLMNLTHTGRLKTMPYHTHLEINGIDVIRPMLEITENQIIGYGHKHFVPVEKSKCPIDKLTHREEMNDLMKTMFKSTPKARESMNRALKNKDQFELWFDLDTE